jgi:hypothetical protein
MEDLNQAGTLRLDPGTTKNPDGRVAYLTPEVKVALVAGTIPGTATN